MAITYFNYMVWEKVSLVFIFFSVVVAYLISYKKLTPQKFILLVGKISSGNSN